MAKGQMIVMSLLGILGLAAIGGGLYLGTYVEDQLQQGIEDLLVIDPDFPTDDPKGYADWLRNTDPDDTPKYKKYYFWNLTNPDEYLTGSKPILEELGPYSYRQYDIKINDTVAITDTTVSYNTWTYYEFDAGTSFDGADPVNDKIVNVNPQYLGVLESFGGSEAAFITAFVGPTIANIIEGLTTDFIFNVQVQGEGLAMADIMDGLNVNFVGNLPYLAGASGLAEIMDGLTTNFAEGVIIQGMASVLETIQQGVVPEFHTAVNATTGANLLLAEWGATLGGFPGDATAALNDFFNTVSHTATYLQGVGQYNGVNAGFSNETANKLLLNGTGSGIPGWTQDTTSGTGVLGFLTYYQYAIEQSHSMDNATLQAIYGASQIQLDLAANYLLNYLIADNAAVEATYQGNNGGETTLEAANRLFLEQWDNATSSPTPLDLDGDENSDGFELDTPANLPFAVAEQLWNHTNSLALTNASGITLWFYAAAGDPTANAYVDSFGLSPSQEAEIMTWLNDFKDGFAENQVFNAPLSPVYQLGLTDRTDIGYFQWANGALTSDISVASLDPSIPAPIEFWYYESSTLTLANVTTLMTGPYNLTNAEGLGGFLLLGQQATLGANATALALLQGGYGNLNLADIGSLLDYLQNILINNIVLSQLPITTYADAGYYHWGNGTITDGLALYQLDPSVPAPIEFWNVTGSSLSLATSKALTSGTLNLTTTEGVGTLLTFANASAGDTTSLGTLQALFEAPALTQGDVANLLTYFNYVNNTLVLGDLKASYGVASWKEVGYFHWGDNSVTGGLTTVAVDPTSAPGSIEYWASAGMNISLANSLELLRDGATLTSSLLVGLAMLPTTTVAIFNAALNTTLTDAEFTGLRAYLLHLMNVFVKGYILDPIFALGGGLITTRTANQWLWDYTDPLLGFLALNLDPTIDPAGNFFDTYATEDDVPADLADTYMTGGDDLDNVGQYVDWNGMTEISGVWQNNETITGTDATQFHPDVKDDETLKAFVSDLLRVVDLVYQEDVKVEGIDLLRFVLSTATLGLSDNYHQTVVGLANMTASLGAPLFLSKPHFLDADAAATSNLVTGLSPNADEHDTVIDVEPISGATLSARKRLQLNFRVTQNDFVNTGQTTAYIPVLWVEEGADITPDQADSFKEAVYGAQRLQQVATIGGPAIGALLLLSAVMIAIRRKS